MNGKGPSFFQHTQGLQQNLVALCGINRVEKHVKQFRANVKAAIDEQ